MDEIKTMNWDWEKLQQQHKNRKPGMGGGGKTPPPQFDDLLNRFKNIKFPMGPALLVVLVILIIAGVTMVYKVDQREVGVIQRFGRYVRVTYPGLHFKLPLGIETLHIVNVDESRRVEFGLSSPASIRERSLFSSRKQLPSGGYNESLMLTGDLNVVVVPWVVQYNIKEPIKFLFKVHEPEMLLRDLAEATMRLVVGDRSVNEVILMRDEIASEARKLLQKNLDDAQTGIRLTALELGKTNVPPRVQPSFNAVNKAEQEKETMIFNARKEYNKAIPAAQGDAEKTIREAEGYALDRINRARGDASRFLALYKEYEKAKDVTRRRLYLETMKKVLPKLGKKYLIDEDQKNVLPLLNLKNGDGGVVK